MGYSSHDWNRFTSIATIVASLVAAFALIFSVIQFSQSIGQFDKQLTYQKKQDSIVFNLQIEQIRYERRNDSIANEEQLMQFQEILSVYTQQANALERSYNETHIKNNPKISSKLSVLPKSDSVFNYILEIKNVGELPACHLEGRIFIVGINEKDTTVGTTVVIDQGNCIAANEGDKYDRPLFSYVNDTAGNRLKTMYLVFKIEYSREDFSNKDSINQYYFVTPFITEDKQLAITKGSTRLWERQYIDNIIQKYSTSVSSK